MNQIALIGCAHIHTPGFARTLAARDDVKVARVWDPQRERAAHFAKTLDAEVAEGYEAVLADDKIKSVVICSQTRLHETLVLATARARKHMFVEKPLGMNSRDALSMATAVADAGVMFQTGFFQRSDPKNRLIKGMIEKGSFGQITRVRGSNVHSGALGNWFASKPDAPHDDWRWTADIKEAGVGAYGDLGAHAIDILMWWLGGVKAATGQIDNATNTYGCDETGEGLLRFHNNVIGTMAAGWVDLVDPVKYLLSGTEGHAAVIDGKLHLISKKDGRFDKSTIVRDNELPPPAGHAFELFLDALSGKEIPVALVSPTEAAERVSVIEAIYEGAKSNTWQTPHFSPDTDNAADTTRLRRS